MKIHLAGDGGKGFREVADEFGIPYVMTSYYYHSDAPTGGSGGEWKLDYRDHPDCKGLIMDSGAFTYINAQSTHDDDAVDWWEFSERYAEYVRDNEVKRWIELDLDNVRGLKFTRELREFMEDIVGWQCIPVWHRTRGKDAYLDLADRYNRIAMGGFPWREIRENEFRYLPWFIKQAHRRNCRVHALGFQPRVELLEKYPFDSTDSANWMWNTIYGTVYKFDGRRIYDVDHDKKVTDEMYRHSCREWVKFARYMDGRNEVDLPMGPW